MRHGRLHTLIWLLIFGGLIAVALGLSITRSDAAFGWSVATGGAVAVAAGVLLIVVRSRMDDEP